MDINEARHREPLPWHPAVLPPPGFRLEYDGVTFEAMIARSYLNVFLVRWRTHCTSCGAELRTMSTAKGWRQLQAKRCKTCIETSDTTDASRRIVSKA
jgi:hypothetical protein